jgi:hypothetical protein
MIENFNRQILNQNNGSIISNFKDSKDFKFQEFHI